MVDDSAPDPVSQDEGLIPPDPRAPREVASAAIVAPSVSSASAQLAHLASGRMTAPEDVVRRVAEARAAQGAWAKLAILDRAKILQQARDRVLDGAESIARLIHEETGKPEIEALLAEVLPTADVVDYWADSMEEFLDPVEVPIDTMTYRGKSAFLYREARGVIALITPWNYPLAIPLRTLVPALLAGNAVVFKPSEVAPGVGALIDELFRGIVPPGVVQVLHGGGDVGAALAAADVDLVVFTGGVAAGREVAHACAERVSPCALELGGKDAAIVLADADLDRAVNGVVWGALTNAGQNCAAIERVYVERPIADVFKERVVAAVRALSRPGDLAADLTRPREQIAIAQHIDTAVSRGAKRLFESGAPGDGGGLVPTVLEVPDDDSPLMQEETFGPVIPIVTVEDADEAVARANASRFGLTASLWTSNLRRGEELAQRLRAGVVTINNHAFTGALPAAPWSGVGETGYGVTNSPLALESLTRPRFVLTDRGSSKREMWWYPYTPALRTIALALTVLRSGTSGIFAKTAALLRLLVTVPKRLF